MNNPLYSDIEMGWDTLIDYPEDAVINGYPYVELFKNTSATGEIATYTQEGLDPNASMPLHEHQ